jgi:parallel beta-helix repeat protein
MKDKMKTIITCCIFVISISIIILDHGSEVVQAPLTFVSGIQYDGAGGPWNSTGNPYIVVGDVTIPIGQTLTINPGVEVRFDGYYRISVDGTIKVVGTEADRVTITSNKIAPKPSDWHTIYINPSGRAEIQYCNIHYGAYGIYLSSSSNNNISNNNISSNSWPGIRLSSSSNNFIAYNNISDNEAGVFLESSFNNTIISNNIFSNSWAAIYIWQSSNNTVINNNVSNNHYGIYLQWAPENDIINNKLVNDGVYILGSQRSHYNTQTIPTNNTVNGKQLLYYKDTTGIDISGVSLGQIILANCTDMNIEDLRINNTDVGIEIAFSTNIKTTTNEFANNINGILLYSSFNNSVIKNNISGNGVGIWLYTSSNNVITRTNISANWRGLYLLSSSNNNKIIRNNVTSNNEDGFHLSSSSSNCIYHNNITNNVNQAFDNMDNNFWNDIYPSGGNYWSNYVGLDLNSTPSQNVPPPDGMGDTPYVIDPDSQDNYPLISPYNPILPPSPPTNLGIQLTGLNSQNVTLTWTLSGDDGAGNNNVFGYSVSYSMSYNSSKEVYDFLGFVPNGTTSFIHVNGGKGNPATYFYYVSAWALDRSSTHSDEQAAKFTKALLTGKYIISIPNLQNDENIDNVLQDLKFNIVWYYNNTDILDPWKSYNPSKPFNDLAKVNRTMGLWVNVLDDSNITYAAIVPKFTNIELKVGWNFVSYPSFIERNVSEALSGIAYERIEGYSPLPPQHLRIYSGDDLMKPGYGYWIKVKADATWTVSN